MSVKLCWDLDLFEMVITILLFLDAFRPSDQKSEGHLNALGLLFIFLGKVKINGQLL